MLLQNLLDDYLASDHTAGHRASDPHHAQWWKVQLGARPVESLSHANIGHALSQLESSGLKSTTAAFYLRLLRRACTWGIETGALRSNPCAGMPLPKERRVPIRVLTLKEEEALCEALGEPYAMWVRFAILTGLRQSEQFTLRWRDVHLNRAVVLVPYPSTGAIAEVALSPDAVLLLNELRRRANSLWVFCDPEHPSQPVDVHQFYTTRWVNAVRHANIPWCAWKDLRHTCGARLGALGWSAEAIAGFLRHWNKKQAFVYRAWDPKRQEAARRKPRLGVMKAIDASVAEFQAAILRDRAAQPVTFGELARFYALHHLKDRPSRVVFDRMYQQFWTRWAERTATSIQKKEVLAWYMGLGQTPGHANKALTFLRSLYNWAARLDFIQDHNPATHILRYKEESRERFLSVDELRLVLRSLPHAYPKFRAYLLLLLFTGARRSEARHMRWRDLDWSTHIWRKPNTKNGKPHMVPVPQQALEAIRHLQRVNEWIFPGDNGRPWSAASVEKTWGIFRRRIGLDDVRLHDLRRTCASYLAIQGENLPTIQNVLNHHSLTPTSIYARLNVKAVDRALQDQADRIWRLTDQPAIPVMGQSRAEIPCLPNQKLSVVNGP